MGFKLFHMVPRYQIVEVTVLSELVTNPVPGLRFADFPRFVPPKFIFDVSPFHYLSISQFESISQLLGRSRRTFITFLHPRSFSLRVRWASEQ